MNIVDHKASTDKVIWRCHKRINPHDIKINIRNDSIFEGFQSKINVLYFLLYLYFLENLSIIESLNKCNDFCSQIGETGTTAQTISNFYAKVRDKIRVKMHKSLEKEPIGVEINDKLGYASIEIDERKIISQGNEIYWMFGSIDCNTKQAGVKWVLTERTKNKLIPSVVKHVNTLNDNVEIDEDNEDNFDELQV